MKLQRIPGGKKTFLFNWDDGRGGGIIWGKKEMNTYLEGVISGGGEGEAIDGIKFFPEK